MSMVIQSELEDDPVARTSCFVICPIGDGDAEVGSPEKEVFENSIEVYEEVILPACQAFGLEPIRSDQISGTGEIPEQVCQRLRNDDVVVADLTGGNPNVMYELGLRHTTGLLTIQLGEKGRLPFDIAAIRTIMFKRTQGGLIQARKGLTEALSSGLASGGDRVTATRVWLNQPVSAAPSSVAQPGYEEAGTLEKLVDLEDFMGRLPESMNKVTSIMEAMTTLTGKAGEEAQAAKSRKAPTSARLHLANALARDLTPHADELKEVATDFEMAVQKVEPGVRHILSIPEGGPEEKEIAEFRENLSRALVPTASYIDSARGLIGQLSTSGEVTRSLRKVNGETRSAVRRLVKASEQILSWGELLPETT